PPLGRRDGAGHVVRTRPREATDHVLPVRRVAVLEVRAGPGGDPLAGDEVLEVLGHVRYWAKVLGLGCQRGSGTSGHSHRAAALAPTRGRTSRVMRRIPQTMRTCETTWATPRRRFHDEMLAHSPAAITVVTPRR